MWNVDSKLLGLAGWLNVWGWICLLGSAHCHTWRPLAQVVLSASLPFVPCCGVSPDESHSLQENLVSLVAAWVAEAVSQVNFGKSLWAFTNVGSRFLLRLFDMVDGDNIVELTDLR